MPNVNDIYQSKYLTAADLKGQAHQVCIDSVAAEILGQGSDAAHKLVCVLRGHQKGLVLNKTNSLMIAASYGDVTESWHGKVIEIYPENVSFQGKIAPAIRVRVPAPAATAAAAPEANSPPPADFDDDIPW